MGKPDQGSAAAEGARRATGDAAGPGRSGRPPALAMPANKKKDPRYAEIYRDMPGYSGMRPRRLRPMIVGVPPRVGAAYAGIGRRNCGSRLLIHQMAFKPRFPGVLGSLK